MPFERSKENDYEPLSASSGTANRRSDDSSLRPLRAGSDATSPSSQNHANLRYSPDQEAVNESVSVDTPSAEPGTKARAGERLTPKTAKKARRDEKDRELLTQDRWLVRNGHF